MQYLYKDFSKCITFLRASRHPEKLKTDYQFARIHTSSLINIEKILNRPITIFSNSDDINMSAAELRFTKTRPTSFYKKHNLL